MLQLFPDYLINLPNVLRDFQPLVDCHLYEMKIIYHYACMEVHQNTKLPKVENISTEWRLRLEENNIDVVKLLLNREIKEEKLKIGLVPDLKLPKWAIAKWQSFMDREYDAMRKFIKKVRLHQTNKKLLEYIWKTIDELLTLARKAMTKLLAYFTGALTKHMFDNQFMQDVFDSDGMALYDKSCQEEYEEVMNGYKMRERKTPIDKIKSAGPTPKKCITKICM